MQTKIMGAILGATMLLAPATAARAADIVDTIAGTPNLSMFASVIKAAGIADKLKGPGPFTVFAPTDDAFKRLPANRMTDLMKPENKDRLVKLLTYHVIASRLTSEDIGDKDFKMKSVNGKEIEIDADEPEQGIKINTGKITHADIAADNGVIHEISRVLMP
jgi:uncharacterized surface protein with fasciclin (FAS1) repeats